LDLIIKSINNVTGI